MASKPVSNASVVNTPTAVHGRPPAFSVVQTQHVCVSCSYPIVLTIVCHSGIQCSGFLCSFAGKLALDSRTTLNLDLA